MRTIRAADAVPSKWSLGRRKLAPVDFDFGWIDPVRLSNIAIALFQNGHELFPAVRKSTSRSATKIRFDAASSYDLVHRAKIRYLC
ncbi:MAG TPA: hypothetical protein VFL62_24430 [Bradyrhizobium sp.]|uniref:hypothetical protein n=1 Tax=Bradyrhizobium sp. TaxID=376 RepID=UPI002D80CD54|nr:hypothetical protein [Bradyrhizobium sp.]HET7889389.1 hypothetical protein [Bradyrhizobium sp.]